MTKVQNLNKKVRIQGILLNGAPQWGRRQNIGWRMGSVDIKGSSGSEGGSEANRGPQAHSLSAILVLLCTRWGAPSLQ